METHLKEAMTAGLLVEILDPTGQYIGQAVFFDYRGRPVPAVGDTMSCQIVSFVSGRREKIVGLVRTRHFDVQQQDDGQPCVWARLEVEQTEVTKKPPRRTPRFSTN
ncbi:MAG: hypothetical protein KF708_12085 [Pirellulales bacterium]|nr:hypothetical protein [Pirellulales bacterium]